MIFDAGTGIRNLGLAMVAEQVPLQAEIFLTHTHMDHINGLPFFQPAYSPCNSFRVWAGHLLGRGLRVEQVLKQWMGPSFFPVPIETIQPHVTFHDFLPGYRLELGDGIVLHTIALNHPGGATGYRIDYDGRAICIITDVEHKNSEPDPEIVDLVRGSEFFVYDTTYTEEEYRKYMGWGHSTWEHGGKIGLAANCAGMIAFHHEPQHDDDYLDEMARQIQQRHPGAIVASEGMVLNI